MKLAVFAAPMALALPAPAVAADWVWVAETTAGHRHFIDVSRIMRISPNIVRWWEKVEYKNHPENWSSDITLVEAECSERKSRNLSINVYYLNGNNESTSQPSNWKYVVPDTVRETKFDFVCRK